MNEDKTTIERRGFIASVALGALALFAPKPLIVLPEKKIFTGMGFQSKDMMSMIRRAYNYQVTAGNEVVGISITDDFYDELIEGFETSRCVSRKFRSKPLPSEIRLLGVNVYTLSGNKSYIVTKDERGAIQTSPVS